MKKLFLLWVLILPIGLLAQDTLNKVSVLPQPLAPGDTTRYPLYIPAVVAPAALTLTAAPGTSHLGGGNMTTSWTYNNSFPGPTIKATLGDSVSVVFQNNLSQPSIIHWHGMLVNTANDGHPKTAVPGNSSYAYHYKIKNRAALNWYHPHPDMLTGEQVYNGLAGGFIINDAEEAAHNLPSGNYEIPLVLRDATFNNNGNLNYAPTGGGMFGKTPLVNGTLRPYLNVQRAVYRFRILCGTNARVFNLTLTGGLSFKLIGNDGGLLPVSSAQTQLTLSSGERLDVLVDFRSVANNTNIVLQDVNANWELLQFRINSPGIINYTGNLSPTSTIVPLSNPDTTRTFSFDGMNKINGLVYDIDRIDWTARFDHVEKWIFISNGNGPHMAHVHGASFQVISRTGGRGQVFPWETGWKDVVLVDNGETVAVLIKFDAYAGEFLMHCHNLEHEDMGMMANFLVVDDPGFTWIGISSNNWFTASNWSGGKVPGASDVVNIEKGFPYAPVIPSGTIATCKKLNLASGITVTIGTNAQLNVLE